jgi:hypothetical protein
MSLGFASFLALLLSLYLGLYVRRRMMIRAAQSRSTRRTVDEVAGRLRHGDVVYMSSRRMKWDAVGPYYGVLSQNYMGTPFYHVFMVVRGEDGRGLDALHFATEGYDACIGRHPSCPENPNVGRGDLGAFLRSLWYYRPLLRVYRRAVPLPCDSFKMGGTDLCRLRFPPLHMVGLTVLFPSLLDPLCPETYANCNSFVGLLLERCGALPRRRDANSVYIPSRLQREFLPSAGYSLNDTVELMF